MNTYILFLLTFYVLLVVYTLLVLLPRYVDRCEQQNKQIEQETAEAFKEWLVFGYIPAMQYQQSRDAVARKIKAHRQRQRIKKQLKEQKQ